MVFRILLALVCSYPFLLVQAEEDPFSLPKLVAIQDRKYYLNHGLSFQLGYLPLDAFNKSILLGASYTYYVSDFVGWEVINANYAANQDTGLKNDLRDQFLADVAGVLDFPNYYATTNIVYTPMYTKNLLFNKSLIYGDISFTFGGGMMNFDSQGNKGLIQLGTIMRFYTAPSRSLKFDFRFMVPLDVQSLNFKSNLSILIAYAFQLGDPPQGRNYKEVQEEFELE